MLRAAKSLDAAVKGARLNELRGDPKLVPAVRTRETILLLDMAQPRQQTLVARDSDKASKLADSGRPAHENLNSTGIAREIGFVLLGHQDFAWSRTYGARKHRLRNQNRHFRNPPVRESVFVLAKNRLRIVV